MKNGYTHRFGKKIGGIKSIRLTPVHNIQSAACDPQTGRYRSITLRKPAEFAECSFAENAARYREITDLRSGIPSVEHTLEFHTDKIDGESDRFIRMLANTSLCGLAAVITTNNNIRLVVGYSEEHLAERPLKLQKIAADSGNTNTDSGHEAICLFSRDTAKARIIDGNIG